ncbi:hypothetical protein TNCT_458641, partial [Trichonephila clavata]
MVASRRFAFQREHSNVKKKSKDLVFQNEIGCMMHSFGDSAYPLKASVALIERIIRDQMNMLLKKATQLNLKQRGNNLTHGHLLLLLQKNENKFRRLMYYLKMRDASELIRKKKYDDLP